MRLSVSGVLFALAIATAAPAGAQDASSAASCAGLTEEEAQGNLDAGPTYANRARLDPDGDGVACEPDELGDACAGLSAEDAHARLDAEPTYANRARLDPDGDGVACEADERAPGDVGVDRSTASELPASGAGPAVASPILAAVTALLAAGAAVLGWGRRRR